MQDIPIYLIMPLLAAILYAAAGLFFKEAFRNGAGSIQSFVLTSWVMSLCFAPFIFWESQPIPWHQIHLPLITALAFFAGHWLTFSAIKAGDVSLVMPVLGTKSVFVALFAWLIFGIEIPRSMWLATLLTAVAVYVLGKTDQPGSQRRVPLATGLTILSAGAFGLCDALVQQWATLFGLKAFLTLMFGGVGLMASLLVPHFNKPLKSLDQKTLAWLGAGAMLTAQQAMLIGMAVAMFQNATGVNVVYSSRGLWAIVMVWLLARVSGYRAESTPRRILFMRLIGAALMVTAILLAIFSSKSSSPEIFIEQEA